MTLPSVGEFGAMGAWQEDTRHAPWAELELENRDVRSASEFKFRVAYPYLPLHINKASLDVNYDAKDSCLHEGVNDNNA